METKPEGDGYLNRQCETENRGFSVISQFMNICSHNILVGKLIKDIKKYIHNSIFVKPKLS